MQPSLSKISLAILLTRMVLGPTSSVPALEPVQVGRQLETSENGRRDWTAILSLRTKLIA